MSRTSFPFSCCDIMADRRPAYIECSRVKRMKPLQRNSLFPPKDHRPLFLLPSVSVYPYSCSQSRWWSRARSRPFFPGRVSPAPCRRGYLYPAARPRHSSSQAKQSTQEALHLLQPRYLLSFLLARDHRDQDVWLRRRQLRVRLRLQLRRRMQRVGI